MTHVARALILATLFGISMIPAHTARAHRGQLYVLTDLGTLGGAISWTTGINNQGVVVGDSTLPGDTVQHAFVWSQSSMHDLGAYRPDLSSHAAAINDAGQIAGAWDVSDVLPPGNAICWTPGPCHPVLWTHGIPHELAGLGGVNSGPNDLNERGEVVGVAEPADLTPFGPCGGFCRPRKPTIWQGNTVTVLPSLGGPSGAARGINDRGQIVGRSDLSATIDPLFNQTDFHATMWYRGQVHDLGTLPGGPRSYAYFINQRSQVIGWSNVGGSTVQHGFLWESGQMTDLGTLAGDQRSNANGINNRGQVVGDSCSPTCNDDTRGYLWQDGTMIDLSAHLQNAPGWTVDHAVAINDQGQIAGIGFDSSGNDRAILLTPVQ